MSRGPNKLPAFLFLELFDEATKHHQEGRFTEAERCYDMLLSQNHDNSGLMATIGTLYLQTGKYGLAIHFLEASLKGRKQSDVLSNLSIAYKSSGQQDKALEYAEKACKVVEPSAEALANYSGFFTNTGSPDKSIGLCEKALQIKPELAVAHWNLALALLEKGEWDRGWDEHDWGLRLQKGSSTVMRVDRKINDAPYWDGTPGKTVAVYGEQGIGDEIMFSSMLPDLMQQNDVVFECHKRLKHLFEHSFPGLPCYGTREDTKITWPHDHKIDYRVSIGSLGKWFRRSKEAFPGRPYLSAESAPKGSKFRVGISWTGGQKAGRVITRSVPLPWWPSILNNDCEFVSLQYTDCDAELEVMRKQGYEIKTFPEVKAEDYYETAKLVMSCDLVISVCTSLVHLAGALGVPCWVMVPSRPAWRYGISGPMPWYRSVRLYRQRDSWMPVVEKVGFDLSEVLEKRKAA